jgi:hypothetical protein
MKTKRRVRNRQGRCYELAYDVMLFEPGAERFTLVHGWMRRLTDWIAHAWIETGAGTVYEPVGNRYYTDAEFAARMPVVERRYSKAEAVRLSLETHHSGPWHIPTPPGDRPVKFSPILD